MEINATEVQQKLNIIDNQLIKLQEEKIRAEEKHKRLGVERQQVLAQLKELGVKAPADLKELEKLLATELNTLQADVTATINQLPEDIQNAVR